MCVFIPSPIRVGTLLIEVPGTPIGASFFNLNWNLLGRIVWTEPRRNPSLNTGLELSSYHCTIRQIIFLGHPVGIWYYVLVGYCLVIFCKCGRGWVGSLVNHSSRVESRISIRLYQDCHSSTTFYWVHRLGMPYHPILYPMYILPKYDVAEIKTLSWLIFEEQYCILEFARASHAWNSGSCGGIPNRTLQMHHKKCPLTFK